MSEKKVSLNPNAASFSFKPNANAAAWTPGKVFVPQSVPVPVPVVSTPVPVPPPAVVSTPEVKDSVQEGGPKPVEVPAKPVWNIKHTPKVEPPAVVKETATKPPVATKPETASQSPQITFGEFDKSEKKPEQAKQVTKPAAPTTEVPAAATNGATQPTVAAPAPAPAAAAAEVSGKPAPMSWNKIAATPPAPQPVRTFAPSAAHSQKAGQRPGANTAKDGGKNTQNESKKGNQNDSKRGERGGKKKDEKKSDKDKKGRGGQQGKQQQQQQQQQTKQEVPKVAPFDGKSAPTPAEAANKGGVVLPTSTAEPVVKTPVVGGSSVPSFAAAAAKATQAKVTPPPVRPKPAPAPAPAPKPVPEAPKQAVAPKAVPAPAPAPVVTPAPVAAPKVVPAAPAPVVAPVKSIPVTVKKVKEEPAPVAPETVAPVEPAVVTPAPVAPVTTPAVAATTAPRAAAEGDNWRSAPAPIPRALRPGGGGGGSRAEGLGGPDRSISTNQQAGDKSPNEGGRWGRQVLPPGPQEDPSTSWAEAPKGIRHTLFSLIELKDLNGNPPANLNMELPIIHLYAHKVLEEETRRVAMEGKGRGGQGPIRNKGPAKAYEKPKWAAGTLEGEEAEVMRKALFILNKLTLEKFHRLSDEFLNVGFTSVSLLEMAIDIIVDKAQMEHHFGAMYADLCLKLAKSPLAELGDEGKGKQFKKSLLQRCQQEFEKNQSEILEKLSEMEVAEEREAAILMTRKRYLGHMKFVGQLFRVQLLSDKIMHICVQELFGDSENIDEEKIQCLCTLLTTIGAQLEESAVGKADKAKMMKKYLKEISALGENVKISSRIRFMCKDLLEMRANGWNARREEESAKTLAQIHQDADREMNKQQAGRNSPRAGNQGGNTPRGGAGAGNRSPRLGGGSQDVRASQQPADDGWEKVKAPSNRQQGGGNRRIQGQGTGSNNSSFNETSSPRPGGGGFSAFNDKEKRDKQEKKEKKLLKEKKEAKEAKKAAEKALNQSTESSSVVFKMTLDQYANSCKTEFDQYVEGGNVDEVVDSMKEFGSPPSEHVSYMINNVINHIFSKFGTDKACETTAQLLVQLIKEKKILPQESVEAGFARFLENFEDYCCDAPKADTWVPMMMSIMVKGEALTLKCFANAVGAFQSGWKLEEFFGFSTKFFVKVLSVCSGGDQANVTSLLKSSTVDLRKLAEDDAELDKLLKEHNMTI